MNRSFLLLLVLVIFLGAGFGGSFVGGVIYGQSQQDDAEEDRSPRLGAAGQFSEGSGQRGPSRRSQSGQGGGFRAAPAEGETALAPQGDRPGPTEEADPSATNQAPTDFTPAAPQEDSSASGEQDAAPSPEGGNRPGGGRGGAVGTVQGLEDDELSLASVRGEITVTLSDATTIYQVSEAARELLVEGATVRVSGSRDSEGAISAQAVVILPEGTANLFGAAGGSGGRQRGGGP